MAGQGVGNENVHQHRKVQKLGISRMQEKKLTKEEEEANRHLREQLKADIAACENDMFYSKRYYDDEFEYRHVTLPKILHKYIPEDRLLSEEEWRMLGVQQSIGWEHYMIHRPEPHVLLFRREKDYQIKYQKELAAAQASAQAETSRKATGKENTAP